MPTLPASKEYLATQNKFVSQAWVSAITLAATLIISGGTYLLASAIPNSPASFAVAILLYPIFWGGICISIGVAIFNLISLLIWAHSRQKLTNPKSFVSLVIIIFQIIITLIPALLFYWTTTTI